MSPSTRPTPRSPSSTPAPSTRTLCIYPGSENDPYDIAVVVFDKPIRGITPAQLPTLGQFDSVAKNQKFTAVGYGGQEAVNQPGGPVIGYLDTREYAVSTLDRKSTRLN